METEEADLMPQVFLVDGSDDEFDMKLPPTSGQEYLRRVQLEAKQYPAVVVAEINTTGSTPQPSLKLYVTSGLHPAPSGFAPSITWQRTQIANFSQIRQKFAKYKALVKKVKQKPLRKLPHKDDVEAWCRLCFGALKVMPRLCQESISETETQSVGGGENKSERGEKAESSQPAEGSSGSDKDGMPPLLSIVAHIDQPTLLRLLEYHINWFEATGFTTEQGRWFYALAVCLEKPLEPEACSMLRSLARNCANLRATLESANEEILPQLNLLICIVARYFDQLDLADDVPETSPLQI